MKEKERGREGGLEGEEDRRGAEAGRAWGEQGWRRPRRAGGGSAGLAIADHRGLAAECCQQLLPGAIETDPCYWLQQPG